ncbi:co-chaperone GroES [Syntrophomonas wolfei]|uniref:Co-chaperonin GroES n=1 Tax=Syntrophomonas wolfei subsp. wolfei (strain DSM 2245B / Goettingen) TaxID=335541 RepID=CH10_SYNWW|nr:co-chaperone GroES [Syntrophomonas wolfei]Q0AVV0.1 RecName: Full=Co-chaperonin GroES; AltName: Full=10 kDa chaperonin; AltName: Full=Chaperonin-10; Short=Cpn10 [Syntrophomonas wolfei subsp. wolfei str. Goettingen G311]ABI69154.1 groes [Syntrophomonas wolfei subsp. wolfei str. Goettingen G311]
MKIQPLGDRLVVKVAEVAAEKTKSGLYVPDTAKEKPQEGEVLAVGPGAFNDKGERMPMDVAVGDKIIFSKYGGTEIKIDGEEYLVMSQRDILAKIN